MTKRGTATAGLGTVALMALSLAGLAPAAGEIKLDPVNFVPITAAADTEVAAAHVPGAVILIGTARHTLYRQAIGNRLTKPAPEPMRVDTIFDLASLTKVVATTPAVMQLVEQKKLALDAPVARYWPAFAENGKGRITIRNLLTHYSGLAADLDLSNEWSGYDTAMAKIVASKPEMPAGTHYRYSDMNFEILGEVVHRVSGEPLDRYAAKHVFAPLAMADTRFLLPPSLRPRTAPTEDSDGHVHWGDVHDATARWMGGIAGHAGLFSTADNLATYARMMLAGGVWHGVRVLRTATVQAMTQRASPAGGERVRGLGWDLGGPGGFSWFPPDTYGHLGFTGTMIWIDPKAGIFAVVLTNRVYPDGKGNADFLRKAVIATVMHAITSRMAR
jgi:CubicO group peptidase (beta-lactamase class C family)